MDVFSMKCLYNAFSALVLPLKITSRTVSSPLPLML